MIDRPSNVATLRTLWRMANDVQAPAPCWRMVAAPTPKFYVHGVIGGWDTDASDFVERVHATDADTIDVHINSPGGFVYDAVSMYEALLQHSATVNTYVDGLAASAASFLALAGDKVRIARGGRMMIHDAQIVAAGSPADLREAADVADAVSDDIASIYAERAGGKQAAWRQAMTATTWYSSGQAVDSGLAHEVATSTSGPDNRTRLILARHRALTTQGG